MNEQTSDDVTELVERLRAPNYWMSGISTGHEGGNSAPLEAAVTIERLAADIARLTRERDKHKRLINDARVQLGGTTIVLLRVLEEIDVDLDGTTITVNRVSPTGKTPLEQVSLRVLFERNAALDTELLALKEPSHV